MQTFRNNRIPRTSLTVLIALLVLFGNLTFPTIVRADGAIVVNKKADNVTAGDTFCTLREAINNANSDSDTTSGDCAAGSGADTITFAANYTITLTSALPDITTDVTIDGNGAANTIVQASTCDPVNLPGGCTPADWRVFTFTGGTSTIKDMTVRYGNCDSSATCSTSDTTKGGNIYADSTNLTLDAVNVQSGYAYTYGGGIALYNGDLTVQNASLIGGFGMGNRTGTDDGGGIYFRNAGDLLLDNSEVSYNEADAYAGGINIENSNSATIQNGSLIDHNISDDPGVGMYANGSGCVLNIDDSTISNNISNYEDGGGLWINCTTTINNSAISGNTSQNNRGGGIYIASAGDVTITNSAIADNQTTYVSSSGRHGGGIYNLGTLTVVNSTISGNTAEYGDGGGIYNDISGILTITNSTLANNQTTIADSFPYLDGGAIFNNGTLTAGNSTFYNNSASNFGGGVYNAASKTATLINNTFSDNSASSGDSIINYGTLHISNNIIANGTHLSNCINDSGTVSTNINNLIEDNGTSGYECGTPASTADPNLAPLADNGGPTQTFALLSGSPAIDAGDDTVCAASPVNNLDQRGVTRPFGSHCDIGAYEYNSVLKTIKSIGTQDGWILESSETSNKGGTMNTTSNLLYVGDNAQDKQYRSYLSFNTVGLPDDAVITSVKLKIKIQGYVGGNMFTPTKTLGNLMMDIREPYFGTNANLAVSDFQSAVSRNAVGVVGSASTGWRTVTLKSTAYQYINLTGKTQFRLRFQKDDNDDLGNDYLRIFSGNAPAASRPQLIIEYYVP